MAGISGNILKDIEAAYSDILNVPFTGFHAWDHTFEDTTGNTRMVICFHFGTPFSSSASAISGSMAALELHYNTSIWKGIINNCIYIAPESALTPEEAQVSKKFEIYRVEAVQIHPTRMVKWPYVCNLYVRAT
ncbi:hypothetical protein HOLleu_45204 [Holothuria leucospilota]|uniref:Uncharacterized protein n=1 Tax=Holothuria leucospilota TaxID=206669 RepID=A0A9Q0Y8C7_HOLLE|nr:hypothetical protein HOLleu_45204 [Holothuria leucospilota]